MAHHMRGRKTLTIRKIYLLLATWMSPVFSFHHTRPQVLTCPSSFIGRSSLTQRYAFSWFNKDSSTTDGEEDPDGASTDSQLSKNLSEASSIMESFKTSQRIGERSGAALQELSYTMVEGIAADGNIKVTFNGQQIPVGVDIDETYLADIVSKEGKEGIDKLCTELTYAMQDAHYKSGIQVEEKMKAVYTDLEFDTD